MRPSTQKTVATVLAVSVCLVLCVGCSSSSGRSVETAPEGRSLWDIKEVTITQEQAKEIAIDAIRDRQSSATVAKANATLSVQDGRPLWNVSPSKIGDISWMVTIDATNGRVTLAYVAPKR